jgi:Ran GTPase-activating protein (RanGAP) involved in mRNA processing and transport
MFSIRTLYLDHNSFGTRGICLIADAIANNQSLVTLSLTHNNFNDALSVRMMARALLLSSNLIDVNIDGNSIGDSGGSFLLEALRDTRRLQRLVVSPFMSHAIFTQIVDMFPTVQVCFC